eukprot:CAMPEP_0194755608 /NCGR_PEP_ID=MMETSP0323_2-20130528/9455_1 /TAXON_ID=2866 ORGANISM="Crypthecodinium cohnii, Strain Seligo" /NCGR_SAMPLE_ID=MMETSP0323_2 /ASSEMBLY_ACC=CAM_ASM_000346 /LENGTH=88 /DNA_ID=CAMNT_0039674741 /DNA_START=36 /DNA_END=299 /DNA_ORIENTATION=-
MAPSVVVAVVVTMTAMKVVMPMAIMMVVAPGRTLAVLVCVDGLQKISTLWILPVLRGVFLAGTLLPQVNRTEWVVGVVHWSEGMERVS